MSEPSAVDTTFLKGISKEKLSEMVKSKDERIMRIMADPMLKRDLYSGKLTAADQVANATPTAETATAVAEPLPAAPQEPPKEDVLVKLNEEVRKRGFADYQTMIKNFDDKSEYIKVLEKSRDELNARAGAEGGPLGQKIKTQSEELETLKRKLAELEERKTKPEMTNREIIELYEPDFGDAINPEDCADPAMAKTVKKQQQEMARFVKDLKSKVNKMNPSAFNTQLERVMKKNEELQNRMNLLLQKDEMREVRYHDQESRDSFNSVYGEADAFLKKIGVQTSRPYMEIDQAISRAAAVGPEARTAFLNSLPENDRRAFKIAAPLLNRYGEVKNVPINGGTGTVVRFEKYKNVDSIEDLYNLELLKSGELKKRMNEELLAAHRTGAQSVIQSTTTPPGVKGLPGTAEKGEVLPVETSLEQKTARLKELMAMGSVNLIKDRKAHDEYKALKAEVHGIVRQQMAQGTFKRKR